MKEYGKFENQLATYTIEKLPEVGSYEYIYKNDKLLLKVDQFGIITAQIDAPTGEAIFKREERENFSPSLVYISDGKNIFNNFDCYKANKIKITYSPEKAKYVLTFGDIDVITELFVAESSCRFVMNVKIENHGNSEKDFSIISVSYPFLNELLMAPWDKPEWYTKTEFKKDKNAFLTTKYSVSGNSSERRYLTIVENGDINSHEISIERLISSTKNFNIVPSKIGETTEYVLYAYKQCTATLKTAKIGGKGSFAFSRVFAVCKDADKVEEEIDISKSFFEAEKQNTELEALKEKYKNLFSVRSVKTNNEVFDKFVNGFLPLEMYWVSSLDRGWPTGMRGVRDASNDFQGMLCYDKQMCKGVIENILSKQRSDGWYPRQVPFGNGTKFDLRNFVDAVCFFTEFVYDYLAYTDDYSILEKKYPYYDKPEAQDSGYTHIKKGLDYLMQDDSLGVHGLIKMYGGDWLDCLYGAGKEGRGESVMVSCQFIILINYFIELSNKIGEKIDVDRYKNYAENLKTSLNKNAFNGKFYNAYYTDNNAWLFSDKDEDGERRLYIPANAYTITCGAAEGKEDLVISEIEKQKTPDGYRLFSEPIGKTKINGIGKMGSGDFMPYFAENASVYNHGSQLFYIRALAKAKKYDKIADVLGFAMPCFADKHAPEKICAAPYAITNCYQLVPSFKGRILFSFLTGSVSTIEMSVYNWMFGINFTLSNMVITPCVPKEYENAEVVTPFNGHKITIKYIGYGATIKKATVNGEDIEVVGGNAVIDKINIANECKIILLLENN